MPMKILNRNCRFSLRKWILALLVVLFFQPLLFVFGSTNTIAQYSSRTWQTDDGLLHNNVQAVVQTRDGYLWVGTRGGFHWAFHFEIARERI